MIAISIYFRDLKEEAQREVFEEVRSMLLASGDISPREDNETWGEFERRAMREAFNFLTVNNTLKLTI